MAAISITPASVLPGSGAVIEHRYLGGTVTAGMAVRKQTDGTVIAAINDTAANAAAYGIALTGGASGQPVAVQTDGDITIGGTVAVKPYCLGTAGGIIPADDLAGGGEYCTLLGVGISATVIRLAIRVTGAAAAAVS